MTQLHNWLAHWNEQFLDSAKKGKGKKQNDPNAKKCVLLSGSPGIGKTTTAKVVCKMLGFEAVEVICSSILFVLPEEWHVDYLFDVFY